MKLLSIMTPNSPTVRASVAACAWCLAFAADSVAQFGPMAAPSCSGPAAPTQFLPNPHWYPDPPQPPAPYYAYADRTPSAEIRLSAGDWTSGDRAQYSLWWRGPSASTTCFDQSIDDKSAFTPTQTGGWGDWVPAGSQIQGNGRPDQFDWLIAQLEDRYDRGYRRIILFLPAGWVACQDMPASQWWPMAQWRRDWFSATAIQTPGFSPQLGVKGWLESKAADPPELGVYMGYQIGDPCSICYQPNGEATFCHFVEDLDCEPGNPSNPLVDVYRHRCWPWNTTHPPSMTNQDDLKLIWKNIQPWREIGVVRFWIDASSGAASGNATAFRDFAWNENFWDDPQLPSLVDPAEIGGEAFPLTSTAQLPPDQRYTIKDDEFNYAPYVISLPYAENPQMNGEGCPPDPTPQVPMGPHMWDLGIYPVREAAVFPIDWPKCPDGSLKPEWDTAWERLQNLYQWYICRGFTFWQGDLAGPGSGAAERFFGFGVIDKGGDFNGDGVADGSFAYGGDAYWYNEQYQDWNENAYPQPSGVRLTYYHGDMDSDGDVDTDDWDRAMGFGIGNGVILFAQQTPYYLGEGGDTQNPNASHKLNWSPNEMWLPYCPVGTLMGPSGGPP